MRLPLGRKIALLVVGVAVILSGACIIVSDAVNRSTMNKEYVITADSMAGTVAVTVDADRLQRITEKVMAIYNASENKISNDHWEDPGFDAYAEQFAFLMEDEDYLAVRKQIRSIQDISEVDCVYTIWIHPEDKTCVYIVDAAYDDELVPPGCFDFLETESLQYVDDPNNGLPPFFSNTPEYGNRVTSAAPVYNSNGAIIGFAAVDLSMNDVNAKENTFLFMLFIILLILSVVICILAIVYVDRRIVRPINLLSCAASQYGQNQQNGEKQNVFGSLHIRTGDELEILHTSMVQMEQDIDSYIDSLTRTREQLTSARQEADDMHELAHMDALTGIRNKLAYDNETARLDQELQAGSSEFGIVMVDLNYLKQINDTYGHECGNQSIRKLSRLICDVFVHSPVFRIGGDEFAVILRNHDYHAIQELVQVFNGRMQMLAQDTALEPWERITASLGYALFNADTDRFADDVFKRADRRMYERKKEMKALRTA